MSDEVEPGFVRVRLDLAYDGKDFSGWAKQTARRTVQGEIEDALRTVTRSSRTYDLTVAGRTDAGVHARGQVAHVDLPAEVWAEHGGLLLRRMAGRMAPDVRIWRVAEAPVGFNARFSALWRRYAYRISDRPGGADPLTRGHVLWHDRPLDVDAMNAASARMLGEHDFAAYCKKREGATTIRTLQKLSWARDAESGVVTGTVQADAFCHNMVRALVGAMLFVGDGRRPDPWPAQVLAAGVRDPGVHVVRPHGLTLEEVAYPADELLAARNKEARNVRSLPGRGCC
ncbi:tRNA pseudouridine(38-40) synthase TruA [Streptomyces sp. NBC_00121]|uniref:tRNA pseudouridine(38-40) synthase TruA n=1 Tax=unclassified Streptomyces TaxID=2593676 RepID=UPI0028C4EF01|nr:MULTISPECIES: tRNA pseudouridine(38-40) synthase TruA [unclassified Streptomyces]WNO66577.1 tRNA pseudouridine(38-40) synthase TruA [Streptomyces sp. AM2-3-1]WSC71110.1 tRNA pseudouridine(38-40) synthase TruA [Streptomyces sp. NBC_01760]WTE61583.1 tRNA pseudouridine(38-40) synthase TruA [Streptomyces sp. NBC_01617]WTI89001.1 tRNA pseudouridine(38-40) synthase TruA [Streptomyces sp. NBC_00724]